MITTEKLLKKSSTVLFFDMGAESHVTPKNTTHMTSAPIVVTGVHMDLTAALKETVCAKVERLLRHNPRPSWFDRGMERALVGLTRGYSRVLAAYARAHHHHAWPIYEGTNAIVRLYTDARPLPRLLRQAVLQGARHLPPLTAEDPLALFGEWLAEAVKAEVNDPNAMALATVLEPLLIVVMGLVVMLIVMSVMLPIMQMNTWVK